MKTKLTEEFLADNGIYSLVADLSEEESTQFSEATQLLKQLGNTSQAIPFYAIYPAGDGKPVVFSDVPLTQGNVLEKLRAAVSPHESNISSGGTPLQR